jgi:feruloyl esterase
MDARFTVMLDCYTNCLMFSWPKGMTRVFRERQSLKRGWLQRGREQSRCRFLVCSAAFAAIFASTPASAATSIADEACSSLAHGTRFGTSTVIAAEYVTSGSFTGADGSKQSDLPAFCRILAISTPRPSSRIISEVWLPAADRWNGKILGLGNGGAAGRIQTAALADSLRRGFAAATTDMGSYPAGTTGVGFNFGDGRPEAVRDWAYRSTHEMTILAKAAVTRYYGKPATRAYFTGCSTGGHQGLMEALKYPEDYDGIIVGAPAHNRTHLHIRFAALRQLGLNPAASLSGAPLRLWTNEILRSCAGKDGGAPGDKFLSNPLLCRASPRTLQCRVGQASDQCLREEQVRALEQIYDGTRNRRTGELIYYGDVRGAEEQIQLVYGDQPLARNFDITHWVLPPERAKDSFDFDRDMAALDARFPDINAMSPDLSRFAAAGGKIIFFHGWQDGLISPLDTLDYFRRASARGKSKADFARLYMVPGLAHCFGGSGPNAFGQQPGVRSGGSAEDDLLAALDRWSVQGIAPAALVAARYDGGGSLKLTSVPSPATIALRPICPFPMVATYDGRGEVTKASSFKCSAASPPQLERPASKYLR